MYKSQDLTNYEKKCDLYTEKYGNKDDSDHDFPLSLKEVMQYWFSLFPIHEIFSICYNAHFCDFVSDRLVRLDSQMGIVADAEGLWMEIGWISPVFTSFSDS